MTEKIEVDTVATDSRELTKGPSKKKKTKTKKESTSSTRKTTSSKSKSRTKSTSTSTSTSASASASASTPSTSTSTSPKRKKEKMEKKHKKKKKDKNGGLAATANGVKKSSATPKSASIDPSHHNIMAKPKSIAEFVVTCSHHYDKKSAVVEWITENPSAAARLTPTDVGSTLSKISFALEHPETAKLLAEGIHRNGGSVTTAHILAAMRASPIQDSLVAEKMIPYVVDPQNKDRVLEALHMTFYTDDVSKCFAARQSAIS
eukprot:jgi/Psemu1/305956/fgenesh1_kg.228_\